jgi:hypothetical protein
MITSFSVSTAEIDDVEFALQEILERLDPDTRLLKNSVGLISCQPGFIESGVVEALSAELPFEVIGQTSIANTTTGSSELSELSLLVLTSDDVEFVTGLTQPILEEDASGIAKSYEAALEGRDDKPALVIGYVPLLLNVGGDFYVHALGEASGGVPFFGSISVDDTIDYHNSRVLYNGEAYVNQLAFVLLFGAVKPRFYLATISHDKVFNQTGVVDASLGNQLQRVNGAPVAEFLKQQGLTENDKGELEGVNSFPYIVDFNDGTDPVIRVMFAITPEGYAVCGGDIPVGATLSVGYFDEDEILRSSEEELAQIQLNADSGAILVFSCIGRYLNLGYNADGEANLLRAALDKTGIPYSLTYSGGEICPVHSKDDATLLTNRYHNSTLIVCVL